MFSVNQERASLNSISTIGLVQAVQENTIVPWRRALRIIRKVLATHCKSQALELASHGIAKPGMCLLVRNEEEVVSTSLVHQEGTSSRLMENQRIKTIKKTEHLEPNKPEIITSQNPNRIGTYQSKETSKCNLNEWPQLTPHVTKQPLTNAP